MTEDAAREWLRDQFGDRAYALLEPFVADLLAANQTQNLISRSTEDAIWQRHILDSAQLAGFAPDARHWLDIGSGPGLPGLVIAIVTGKPILLLEPRRMRAEFLHQTVAKLGLTNARVVQRTIERLPNEVFDAVTARAFAPLPELISSTERFTESSTIWVLPKGRTAEVELAEAQRTWHGVFHVEHSLSDPNARIIVASGVTAR